MSLSGFSLPLGSTLPGCVQLKSTDNIVLDWGRSIRYAQERENTGFFQRPITGPKSIEMARSPHNSGQEALKVSRGVDHEKGNSDCWAVRRAHEHISFNGRCFGPRRGTAGEGGETDTGCGRRGPDASFPDEILEGAGRYRQDVREVNKDLQPGRGRKMVSASSPETKILKDRHDYL